MKLKQKRNKESIKAGAKYLDESKQDEPSFWVLEKLKWRNWQKIVLRN